MDKLRDKHEKHEDHDKDEKKDKKKKKPGSFDYFENFVQASQAACDASSILYSLLTNLKDRNDRVEEIHKIENDADILYHNMMHALNKSFITPIERDDIRMLASSIDDVVDALDDIVMDFYIYNVTHVTDEIVEFAALLNRSCIALKKLLDEFKDYKKSKKIVDYIIEINDIEEIGDKLYQTAIRKLFTSNANPIEIIKYSRIIEVMESCCDACESVADLIEGVILKNS